MTSPYHPQAIGLTERFNHTLSDLIFVYINTEYLDWNKILTFVTFADSTAIKSTTRFSALNLAYGRDPSCTSHTIFLYHSKYNQDLYLDQLASRSETTGQPSRARTIDHQQDSKLRYQAYHNIYLSPNGLVLISTPIRQSGLCEKLSLKSKGLYRILRQISPVNYIIAPTAPPNNRRSHGPQTMPPSQLKPFHRHRSPP